MSSYEHMLKYPALSPTSTEERTINRTGVGHLSGVRAGMTDACGDGARVRLQGKTIWIMPEEGYIPGAVQEVRDGRRVGDTEDLAS